MGVLGEELVKRAKLDFSHTNNSGIDELVKRGEKAKKHLEDLKEYREKISRYGNLRMRKKKLPYIRKTLNG